jgi:hypothetical protein
MLFMRNRGASDPASRRQSTEEATGDKTKYNKPKAW